jgi:hypothetical protein
MAHDKTKCLDCGERLVDEERIRTVGCCPACEVVLRRTWHRMDKLEQEQRERYGY